MAEWKPCILCVHKAYYWMCRITRNAMVFVACPCTIVYATYDCRYPWLLSVNGLYCKMSSSSAEHPAFSCLLLSTSVSVLHLHRLCISYFLQSWLLVLYILVCLGIHSATSMAMCALHYWPWPPNNVTSNTSVALKVMNTAVELCNARTGTIYLLTTWNDDYGEAARKLKQDKLKSPHARHDDDRCWLYQQWCWCLMSISFWKQRGRGDILHWRFTLVQSDWRDILHYTAKRKLFF